MAQEKPQYINLFFFNEKYIGKRINTDEMVARLGSWQDSNLQIKAGREAVKMIDYYEFIQLINIKNGNLIWRDKIVPEWSNTILKKL